MSTELQPILGKDIHGEPQPQHCKRVAIYVKGQNLQGHPKTVIIHQETTTVTQNEVLKFCVEPEKRATKQLLVCCCHLVNDQIHIIIHWETTSATPGTALEHHLPWNRLDQPKSIEKHCWRLREPCWNTTSSMLPPQWKMVESEWSSLTQLECIKKPHW